MISAITDESHSNVSARVHIIFEVSRVAVIIFRLFSSEYRSNYLSLWLWTTGKLPQHTAEMEIIPEASGLE